MREAYLVNNSQSIASIPLYVKSPVTVRGRTVQRVQFKNLVPSEEFNLGSDISREEKEYYTQFKSILIDLRYRRVEAPVVEDTPQPDLVNEAETESSECQKEVYTLEGLMKMRQVELIDIAISLGLEATTQNSKAEISNMILEKAALE